MQGRARARRFAGAMSANHMVSAARVGSLGGVAAVPMFKATSAVLT